MITDKGHLGDDTSIVKRQFTHQDVDPVLWFPIVGAVDQVPSHLKEWRVMRDFTLRKVEEDTGISNSYLSQLETGKVKNPSFDVVVKICRLYQVHILI